MITLHESDITTFPMDNGIGVLRDVIRAYAEEELNGMFEFYMEYDSEGHLVDELKEERIVKAKAQDKLGYQLFRIYSITKNHENDNLIIRAQHITYDLADNFVESLIANNLTKKQVMELIGSSTVLPHPFNITSPNTTTRSSTKLYRTNPLQMVGGIEGSILQIWGGQIERDNFNLILHDRRGSDDGVKVTYEKNITGLEATFDISGLVTRIFPFVYIEATDNEPARLITVSGKYIDSPHINDYEKIYIRPIDYTHDERINLDGTDTQIRQQLTNIANSYFTETGNDKIKVDMEVRFEHLWETEEYKDLAVLELVGMGDTVTIEHSRLKVNATAIVNYIRYDCIAEKNEEVRLGSVKARLTDNVNRVVDVAEKVEQAQQTANQAIRTANGKNTIYYGPDEPTNGIEGDLWFRVVDGEYTRTYRHDGIQWQLVLSVDVRDAIDEAQQAKDEAQQAVDRANQATQQATNAINQAQTAFDEAQNALGTASNAYDIATTLQGDVTNLSTLVDEHTGQISSITQSVSSLTTRIGDAEGNITTLQQTSASLAARLSDAEGNITTLTATVNGLQTTVSNVQGDVSSVTQLANALQVRMTNAEGSISTLTQTASSLQSTITEVRDSVGRWTKIYRVRTANPLNLTESDGSLLDDSYTYEVTAKVRGTSTQTTAVAIFRANSSGGSGGAGWTLEKIYEQGKTSNHPEFFIDENGRPSIRLYNHSSYYDVEVIHEKTIGRESVSTRTQSQITQLSDAINLRVMKGDVINQINISDESILIDGKRIHITGQTKIDNAAIKSAHIESLDAGKVSVGTLVGHTLQGGFVYGSQFISETSTQQLIIDKDTIRFQTKASAPIPAHFQINLHPTTGEVSFDTNVQAFNFGESGLYSSSIFTQNVEHRSGLNDIYIRPSNTGSLIVRSRGEGIPYRPIIASGITLDSISALTGNNVNVNANLTFAGASGVQASSIYVQNIEQMSGYNDIYIRPSNAGTLHVRSRGTGTPYRPIVASEITVDKTHTEEILSTGNLYLRPAAGGSVQAMTATGVYIPITASSVNVNSVFTQNVEARNQDDVYVRPTNSGGLYVRSRGTGTPYRPVYASAFNQSSSRDYKTNIEKYTDSALEVINDLTVVTYNLKDDLANGILEKKIGFISEDSPAIATADGKAIQTYQLSAYNTKAIQELDSKFKNIEDKVNWLEIENQYLKQKVKQLEEMIA